MELDIIIMREQFNPLRRNFPSNVMYNQITLFRFPAVAAHDAAGLLLAERAPFRDTHTKTLPPTWECERYCCRLFVSRCVCRISSAISGCECVCVLAHGTHSSGGWKWGGSSRENAQGCCLPWTHTHTRTQLHHINTALSVQYARERAAQLQFLFLTYR